ncbi:hypothetical protein LLEC1_02535 [Akanthomyces lecanii]|uniref:Large ribosomal subunit protein eL39 n=1 Tax=Cordyceps confragosa TaxID=2714763 RepID=A0A179IA35_CORDF|nr:hypothetical protein LLEC1_02535 [Akanthomyces lecanii]
MPSLKSFRTKQKLAKSQKQNRPVPQWIRLRTNNSVRYAPSPNSTLSQLLEDEQTAWLTSVSPSTATTLSADIGERPSSASKCPSRCSPSFSFAVLFQIPKPRQVFRHSSPR